MLLRFLEKEIGQIGHGNSGKTSLGADWAVECGECHTYILVEEIVGATRCYNSF